MARKVQPRHSAAGAQVLHLRFIVEDTDGEQIAEQFKEIDWTLSFLLPEEMMPEEMV
ncbi:hypothetical protein ACFL4G_08320 [Thermodesulfobacteriota bacterium]